MSTAPMTMGRCAELRSSRHALRAEQATVRWWRRLVQARLDLAVAGIAMPGPLGEAVALLPGGAPCPEPPRPLELHGATRGGMSPAAPSQLPALRDLDERLARYEHSVCDALDQVTEDLIQALAIDPAAGLRERPEAPRPI
ncbi:hypothetical protein QUV83_15855 [Cellulomonas cellasea]|uniref:hypothetical protein n=1 Tax=Cellulomonas cellasea TaxID=43670 RepID=UPI0025A4B940|nr:hypothetical protein [Cellulomonas cellasea]MDM8086249.1 hypothetical protein [Cellulomonas cellasea]